MFGVSIVTSITQLPFSTMDTMNWKIVNWIRIGEGRLGGGGLPHFSHIFQWDAVRCDDIKYQILIYYKCTARMFLPFSPSPLFTVSEPFSHPKGIPTQPKVDNIVQMMFSMCFLPLPTLSHIIQLIWLPNANRNIEKERKFGGLFVRKWEW